MESWRNYLEELVNRYGLNKVKWIVNEGETSQESIFNGLKSIHNDFGEREDAIVLIHDGVRPLINEKIISESIFSKAKEDNINYFIDSANLMQHYGYTLHSIEGPQENIKITTPVDYYIFRAVCDARENSQIFGIFGGE